MPQGPHPLPSVRTHRPPASTGAGSSPTQPPPPPICLYLPLLLCFPFLVPAPISLGPWSCCVSSGLSYSGSLMFLRFPYSSVSFSAPLCLPPVPCPLSICLRFSLCLSLGLSLFLPPSCPISHLWVWVPILVVLGVPELHLRVAWCQLALGLPLVWAPQKVTGPLKPTAPHRSKV